MSVVSCFAAWCIWPDFCFLSDWGPYRPLCMLAAAWFAGAPIDAVRHATRAKTYRAQSAVMWRQVAEDCSQAALQTQPSCEKVKVPADVVADAAVRLLEWDTSVHNYASCCGDPAPRA